MPLTKEDFKEIEDYLLQTLPDLLRHDPKIATTIEGILAQHFPRRDEFARLLDEVKLIREQMERRFEQVDQRFDQVDQRFDQVDQRFEQMHQTQLELKHDVVKLQAGQESILKQMTGQEAWLRLIVGDLGNDKGQTLEEAVASGLRYGLKNPDITPASIRLRQKLVDSQGVVFEAGFETEVDLIAENGQLTVFEVKASTKPSEVDWFALKVKLTTVQNPGKEVRGVFISPAAGPSIRERCERYGLQLLD